MDEPTSKSEENQGNTNEETKKKCEICGRPAVYRYFSVLSCGACKTFFRRNAEKGPNKFRCTLNGNCEINENNVHTCSSCRLKKCLAVGMKTELIRSPLTIQIKNPRTDQIAQFPTLNLLRNDNSILTVDQWNEISNLSHCYDEYSGFQTSRRFLDEQNLIPAKLRFKPQSFIKLYQDIFQQASSIYLNNRDFLDLSSEDRSVLLNNTILHVTSLSTNYICNKIDLTDSPVYYDALAIVTHPTLVPIAINLAKQFRFDTIIMKILLAILSFSTINYTNYENSSPTSLTNLKQVLDIQNKYIELAWKYLLYKLGYRETIKSFCGILSCLFSVHKTIVQSKSIQWCVDTMDSIAQQTKQTFITD